jgi:hypothetical protein
MGPSLQERKMKKLLAPLIAGLLVTGAFAQAPAAPAAGAPTARTTGDSTAPMGEGTKGDMKKTTAKTHNGKMKHKKHTGAMAK